MVASPGHVVWGVVYAIPATALSTLDGFEPGYARETRRLRDASGVLLEAHLYRWVADDPPLAEAHGLTYQTDLERITLDQLEKLSQASVS